MHILGKNIKHSQPNQYTKEYNIIAIISLTLAIIASLSFMVGSIMIYSYLSKLNKIVLFIPLISNDKLVYLTALSAFFILIGILLYTIIPSILFIHKYGNKASAELKKIFLTDIVAYNLIISGFFLSLPLYSIKLSNWDQSLYILNGIIGMIFIGVPLYIRHSLKVRKNINSKYKTFSFTDYVYSVFLISSSVISISFLLLWGFEVNEYRQKDLSSTISLLTFIFIFLFIPIFLSFIFNSIIIHWKKTDSIFIYIGIFTVSLLWLIPIYQISPIMIRTLGLSDKTEKIYEIRSSEKEPYTYKKIKGRILLNYGENIIFLEANETNYMNSIVIDKNNFKAQKDYLNEAK